MADKTYPKSGLPIRSTADFLPQIFKSETNNKFLSATLDALIQPGTLEKTVGYVGKRYGKTFNGSDVYLDTDQTLRSRYQLEPGVVHFKDQKIENFYDYLDFKNILKFFGNDDGRDNLITDQEHYSWNPPIDWDKFVNYREYYWIPSGPSSIAILGQTQSIISTYRVKLGLTNSYIFTPDGLSNNPGIKLYRGQTYKFIINAPDNGMYIRRNYDTGSLLYNPDLGYTTGQYTVFNGVLWKALSNIPNGDGSTIDKDSQDWEYIEEVTSLAALDYDNGVTNNGIANGTLTFEVPFDAPDVLYYQSQTDPDRFGRFIIADVESNTKINVTSEIIGKSSYTSSNGITLSNGMTVEFLGEVTPSIYQTGTWLVEGVGKNISLTLFDDLVVPKLSLTVPDVLFDNDGFDTVPFDDAAAYAGTKDYITIAKSSKDRNPWSRYNRWFHRSVLEAASGLSSTEFTAPESARAKRPIIEFLPNLKLYNNGGVAKTTVDFIDLFTADVFSTIEGSQGYSVDGEQLFEGARILVVADTDTLANNKIYQINFITHNGTTQIRLSTVDDTNSIIGETVLIRRGNQNQGKMFWFDGSSWIKSQEKTGVNQPPLFDVFDNTSISFADTIKYPVSTFGGSKLLSYKIGTGPVDTELGISLSYLNINNVGDIQFNFDWDIQSFQYKENTTSASLPINSGFYYFSDIEEYHNGWIKTNNKYISPILDYTVLDRDTNILTLNSVDWDIFDTRPLKELYFFVNGAKKNLTYTRVGKQFTFLNTFAKGDAVTVKIFTDIEPDQGYYEIPPGLEKNPFNEDIATFTLGQAVDHTNTGLEFSQEFVGTYPGVSNLRDLDGFQSYSKRFLKHAGISPLVIATLVDKNINLIKSIKFAKKTYSEFKNSFLTLAEELYYDQEPVEFVDLILEELTKSKTVENAFAKSDMIGNGAFSSIEYEVEDVGITVFALSQKFSLSEPSNRAVYVYVNNIQLLVNVDYTFNELLGYVNLSVTLAEGDQIQIREYVSTDSNYIPPTPTKLGLFKKYVPIKYLDDTYQDPRYVIQCHDGSRIAAYNDYRDELILEFEKRIYNNIKTEYNEELFDNDLYFGGYYQNAEWKYSEYTPLVSKDFLTWVSDTNLNYVNNVYFDEQDPFTYSYSTMADPTGSENLPGWWRGVYKYFYDTDRPHTNPWEILGFSIKPTWWEAEYGPAPYTKDNLVLWEDIQLGRIKQGSRAGLHARYARTTILSHIPTDEDGNLVNPLTSGLAQNFSLVRSTGDFKTGDIAPVEHAWYISSEYPFAIITALSLLKPFKFADYGLTKGLLTLNKVGQFVSTSTNKFISVNDIVSSEELNLSYFIKSYLRSRGISETTFNETIAGLDVKLSYRMSGFVDQTEQKFLLDSKSPSSTYSGIFIPNENQQIIFNQSAPISTLTYSGIIFEKRSNGWKIAGYDLEDPKFPYFSALKSQADPVISIGGVSENFLEWTANKFYGNGVVARYNDSFYRSIKSHDSTDTFDLAIWKKLPALPTVGSTTAFRRRAFNTNTLQYLSYGTVLTSIQDVVDFILGYEQYLISRGFVFNDYDSEIKAAKDWTTSAKEFMYWTQHNWELGSFIIVSPAADKVEFTYEIGVPDNVLDSFYNYQIYRSDGLPLTTNFLNFNREFQKFSVEKTNTTDGIYFLKIYQVLKEHVAIFDHKTLFNDIIYEKTTGYRQERIKSRGFRTVDWDGDYTSPGFIYDAVNISSWETFTDYRLGDIVSYKGTNWTNKQNHTSSEFFNDVYWSKLDFEPTKGLIPNFDYRINQFSDYYNLDSDGLQSSQKILGQHAIGFQFRNYLQNLSEDAVTQFKLYQGFIRDKGTMSAATKIFDKLSKSTDDSIVLNEEWAFSEGNFGGVDQYKELEFQLNRYDFNLSPQPILFIPTTDNTTIFSDQYIRIDPTQITIDNNPTGVDIIETSYQSLRTAGYVNLNHVDFIVANTTELEALDILTVTENDHILVSFYDLSWAVFRVTSSPLLSITAAEKESTGVRVHFNRNHKFELGQYVGINNIPNMLGFFEIIDASQTDSILIRATVSGPPAVESSTVLRILEVKNVRYSSSSEITLEDEALMPNMAKSWIDLDDNNRWSVVQKIKAYTGKAVVDYGTVAPQQLGEAVVYAERQLQTITSMSSQNIIIAYIEGTAGLHVKQIISPPDILTGRLGNSFGKSIATSFDNQWLAVGTPLASGVISNYLGEFNTALGYEIGDIVLQNGRLWRAVNNTIADGSTIDINRQDWELVDLIQSDSSGNGVGYRNQGSVTLYYYNGQAWELSITILSPRQATDENFGSVVSLAKDNSTYWLSVSAPGSLSDRGRIYLFQNSGAGWKNYVDTNYLGTYDQTGDTYYPEGAIVWSGESYWKALADSSNDGSTITINSANWQQIDPVSTHSSLPQNLYYEEPGDSTILEILPQTDIAELVKIGDQYGKSMAFNKDGSILVVGAPGSDGLYFTNYRGVWNSERTYNESDVVQQTNAGSGIVGYYRLVGTDVEVDSSLTSINQSPEISESWQQIGDTDFSVPSGKIYIYQRNNLGNYKLAQVISAQMLNEVNDTNDSAITINTGDGFGYAVDIDATGNNIIVGSPYSDIDLQNQGVTYVFTTTSLTTPEWRLKQKLQVQETYTNSLFGSSVSISSTSDRIAVGAKNSGSSITTTFDESKTLFDNSSTKFSEFLGFTGQVYVFERLGGRYVLGEKLETALVEDESFGSGVDVGSSVIVVGSPTYKKNGTVVGNVRTFRKDVAKSSINVLASEQPLTKIDTVKNIFLADTANSIKLSEIQVVDSAKLKLLGPAEQEIKFKTPYDPATYTNGTADQIVDSNTAWFEKNIGKVWWDLSTAKWNYYEQDELAYRVGNWNTLAAGASIDVYEWVETTLLPSEWSALADTTDGLSNNISGQPLYPNDDVYSVKVLYNPETYQPTDTLYYYWVKGSTIVPANSFDREISTASISELISNPGSSGIPFVSFIRKDAMLAYNIKEVLTSTTGVLNVQYYLDDDTSNVIHREYKLISEGVADSLPSAMLETKWIDSLVGFNSIGQAVPDTALSERRKYGISFRPRQGMFKNKFKALEIALTRVNSILLTAPFADTINYTNLNLVDEKPEEILNVYDTEVDTDFDLQTIGSVLGDFFPNRVKQAVLKANIINGELDTIDIIDPGFGYKRVPRIELFGSGKGATASITLDNQGRVNSVTVLTRGKKYDSITISIRPYSVLVNSDTTLNGYWAIYAWDQLRRQFYRIRSQGYDTTRYWEYTDWWKSGYSTSSRIVKEIPYFFNQGSLSLKEGDLIRVKEFGNGGWAVLEKTAPGQGELNGNYIIIARQNGTIQFKDSLYNVSNTSLGYDQVGLYDASEYDPNPSTEIRNIFTAIKEDILTDSLRVEWNNLFFSSIRYVLHDQIQGNKVDWVFKTSFVNAIHNVGPLEQRVNYRNDNLTSYQEYLEEIKPYRTTIREYVSKYTYTDPTNSDFLDFDLPPAYDPVKGSAVPVTFNSGYTEAYPWKFWKDNLGFTISEIVVSLAGAGYTSPPTVIIDGAGTGAKAQAYISNGRVSGIKIINAGIGYTTTPVVTLVGGNGSGNVIAKAVAFLGNSKIRSFNIGVKFDRISKTGNYSTFVNTEKFTATGSSSVFDLSYPLSRDKTKITVFKNGDYVLNNEYNVSLYYKLISGVNQLKGRISFIIPPNAGDAIVISYEKNDQILDAVNRINKYYAPKAGMLGNDLSQLMTGIDFGGVEIQGTTFDVTGGWDALPWFTDGWDSVQSSSDYYFVATGSTTEVTLPEAPADGQLISVYLKRASGDRTIRIDDPAYTSAWDSTSVVNPSAQMPTIIGDGSTKTFQIHEYVDLQDNDILIFRNFESDGSVVISDNNIVDTNLSGGTFANNSGMFTTANGLAAEDIVVEGGKFTSPEKTPAPEENLPGQFLDSLSIKVFQVTPTGAAQMQSVVVASDGVTTRYPIGIVVVESNSIIVYVDKIRLNYAEDSVVDYTIDFNTNEVVLNVAPIAGSTIEILAMGKGGIKLLDYVEFLADGTTTLFLTKADFVSTRNVLVTVDGVEILVGFVNSTEIAESLALDIEPNKTMVQFASAPNEGQIVKIISFEFSTDTNATQESLIRSNRKIITLDGLTREIYLDNYTSLGRGSPLSSIIVEKNGYKLKGPDTYYVIYDGTNNNIVVGTDPVIPVTSVDIKVYINNILQPFVTAYVYDGTTGTVIVNSEFLTLQDVIKIELRTTSEYTIVDSTLIIDNEIDIAAGDLLDITYFSEYATYDIISDVRSGGKVQYQLNREPVSSDYVWVYLNGLRLVKDRDYRVEIPRNVVYLNVSSVLTDSVEIIEFGNAIYKAPRGFEMYKDMLNVSHYNRFTINTVRLATNVNYYDLEITVSDASNLDEPIPDRNIPGMIQVGEEKIQYLEKTGNVLRKLRRGALGTPIETLLHVNTRVINLGISEIIPYSDTQTRENFLSDGVPDDSTMGSYKTVGSLEFVPLQGTRSTAWYRDTIPTTFGPCDQIEVFVGGRRLRKDPIAVYKESLGSTSPAADETLEAEFSVDGITPYIRLTTTPPAGTRILIIRKIGKLWYDRGDTTATTGVSLLDNNTAIAKFIDKKSSELP